MMVTKVIYERLLAVFRLLEAQGALEVHNALPK